jgi:hypothetical protein
VLTKTKNSKQIEHLAFRLSSILIEKSENQLEDYDFSWLDVFTKKGKEDFKSQLYQAISKSIDTGDWSFVEEVIDSWYETAEIKSNKSLMSRIKKGSEETRRGESKSWEEFQKELE